MTTLSRLQLNRRSFLRETGVAAAVAAVGASRYTIAAAAAIGRDRIFYVDPQDGDDTHEGTSPSRPFKTYAERDFRGGDVVLFKRGSVIRDVLRTRDGSENSPIRYGAYGDGPLPSFLGSVSAGDPTKWVERPSSIWRYVEPMASEVCNVVFNRGQSYGVLRWHMNDLRQPGDWHYTGFGRQHKGGEELYLCSSVNPGLAYEDIECVLWGKRKLVGGRRHIILENLCFRNSGVHGFQDSGTRRIVIRNCEFRFIGGAVWDRERRIRFGNAVEFWDGASENTVEGCLFDNIYDSGVTHQGGQTRNIPERLYFRNNLFLHCGLAAYECREPSREIYFEHNTCVNTGGGFSLQGEDPPRPSDPYPQPLGYHVWAWMIDPQTQPGKVYIRRNVFYQSRGAAICLTVAPADERRFVLDHNAYWQAAGKPLVERGNGVKNWAEAMKTSSLMDWGGRRSYRSSEFACYQAESGQDKHSRIVKPLFINEAAGNYYQRPESPCQGLGVQTRIKGN
jgi:hypothetical protein